MLYLSQRDPRWCEVKLGASKITVGRYGCTTTAVSMLSDYFGAWVRPDEIAHNAKNYTPDGLILWQNLSFPTMKFDKRTYGEHDEEIDAALDATAGIAYRQAKAMLKARQA